jgi:hypothetical protein
MPLTVTTGEVAKAYPDIHIRLSILAIVVGADDSGRIDLINANGATVAGEVQSVCSLEHEDLGIMGKLRVN